ncbi:MAG: CNNM domain-containing protein [Alcanivorax sp.]|uniref:CNNM domain-containing protein n=1 Tax=Alloalcanivorax marinus TaxID=1177169 RepID=A0A9Q3UMA7_9GAMM|nr:CNNM domain-containing protein [Alloalcanivorax marinus]MCC4308621.1 CNNM domain-containing protein [Alloalcanivorax marinus]
MTLLIVFAAVSIGFSFLCSILEAALLSITPSYIAGLRDEKPVLFRRLRRLKDDIDDPLAAILTLNTVAHTAGATGVGAQVAVVFGEAYLGVASAVMTLVILIFSEIIPKTIGAKYWRSLAPALPPLLRVMVLVLKPFVWLSKLVTRQFGTGEPDTDIRAELKAMAEIGRDQQALDEDERRVITNILNLHEIKVGKVMTPRTVVRSLRPDDTVDQVRQRLVNQPFSRYPVINEHDEALGYVHKSDLLDVEGGRKIGEVMRGVTPYRSTMNIEYVFGEMLRQRQHLGMVYDELGTWVGLITMEDVIETILGQEIMDETDNVSNLRRYARQRWSRRLRKRDGSA